MIKRIIARLDAKENKLIKGINLEGWKLIGELENYAKKYYFQGGIHVQSPPPFLTLICVNPFLLHNFQTSFFFSFLIFTGLHLSLYQ